MIKIVVYTKFYRYIYKPHFCLQFENLKNLVFFLNSDVLSTKIDAFIIKTY